MTGLWRARAGRDDRGRDGDVAGGVQLEQGEDQLTEIDLIRDGVSFDPAPEDRINGAEDVAGH